jgi:hypothetical protein
MKRIIAVLIGFSVVIGGANASRADELIGEQFEITPPLVQSIGVIIDDSALIKKQWASLQAFTGDGANNTGNVLTVQNCSSFGEKGCEADKHFNFKSMIPYCLDESAHNCISSLVATGPDGIPHEATFVEEFPGKSKYAFTENLNVNLPASGSNFIVSIPSVPHSQGDLYLVASNLEGQKSGSASRFDINTFNTGIFAVKIVQGTYSTPSSSNMASEYEEIGMTVGGGLPTDLSTGKLAACAQLTADRCALAFPMPLDVNFELTLRMKTPIIGWLHGRLGEASASINYDGSGNEIIKIGGKPVIVPIVYTAFPKLEIPEVVKNYYANDPTFETRGFRYGTPNNGGISTIKILDRYDSREFPAALAWYQSLADKAPYSATIWSFRSIQNGGLGNGCINDSKGLNGLVSTNSNMYIAEPPTFNKDDQTLDYKVTSPHFLPDGTVFKGSYNLVINSDFARCIYGFTKAPVSATVSILSSDGSSQVATTVLSESNGWIRLSASNFTFSAPTIKVKLTQPQPAVTPEPEMTIQASPQLLAKKVTITCAKGKLKKKVTAIKPNCPKSYKKVA